MSLRQCTFLLGTFGRRYWPSHSANKLLGQSHSIVPHTSTNNEFKLAVWTFLLRCSVLSVLNTRLRVYMYHANYFFKVIWLWEYKRQPFEVPSNNINYNIKDDVATALRQQSQTASTMQRNVSFSWNCYIVLLSGIRLLKMLFSARSPVCRALQHCGILLHRERENEGEIVMTARSARGQTKYRSLVTSVAYTFFLS
jgi:hypothetical protein